MFLKLEAFGGISFRPEECVSLSTVRVGPYSFALFCIPPFIDYLFRGFNFLVSLSTTVMIDTTM